MSLSKRQLGAVFAKLRAKGLLQYLAKGMASPLAQGKKPAVKMRSGLSESGGYKGSFSQERLSKLMDRIPQAHLSKSGTRTVSVGNPNDLVKWGLTRGVPLPPNQAVHIGGVYHKVSREIFLVDHPYLYAGTDFMHPGRVGYGQIPSFQQKGRRIPRGNITAIFSGGARPVWIDRNVKVGSASSFYHEFGHSIDRWGDYSGTAEWKTAAAAWNVGKKKPGFISSRLGKTVPANEAWAEAYALYGRSKVSRARLKREAPDAYEYMKKLYADIDSVKRTWRAEHKGEITAALVGGGAAALAVRYGVKPEETGRKRKFHGPKNNR